MEASAHLKHTCALLLHAAGQVTRGALRSLTRVRPRRGREIQPCCPTCPAAEPTALSRFEASPKKPQPSRSGKSSSVKCGDSADFIWVSRPRCRLRRIETCRPGSPAGLERGARPHAAPPAGPGPIREFDGDPCATVEDVLASAASFVSEAPVL